jgi:hypothetical protein
MVAIRVMKSVAPSENAPLKDIPIRDTVGAPPLLVFKSRSCRRAPSFSSCWQKSSHAVAYVCALVRSFVITVWTILGKSERPNALVSDCDQGSSQGVDGRLLCGFVECSGRDWGLDQVGYG